MSENMTIEELKEALSAAIPVKSLVEEGRTDDIIRRGAQHEAKNIIVSEKDTARRQQLIAKHLPLFDK